MQMPVIPDSAVRSSSFRRDACICAFLALVTLALYWPVTGFEFNNYDDAEYLTDNPQVHSGLTGQNVLWAFTTGYASNWHPLTWLSHLLDCQLYGLNPAGHHFTNLLFHLVNTLLLFGLLRRMTGAVWRSAFVAALFALHPMHVESVAWVAERKDVLSTFFGLLTLWTWWSYIRTPSSRRYALTLLLFACALMSKPMLVTLPLLMLLLDFWPIGRAQPDKPLLGYAPLVKEKIPFFALTAISCIVTFFVQKAGGAVVLTDMISPGKTCGQCRGFVRPLHFQTSLAPKPGRHLSVSRTHPLVAGRRGGAAARCHQRRRPARRAATALSHCRLALVRHLPRSGHRPGPGRHAISRRPLHLSSRHRFVFDDCLVCHGTTRQPASCKTNFGIRSRLDIGGLLLGFHAPTSILA